MQSSRESGGSISMRDPGLWEVYGTQLAIQLFALRLTIVVL